jgi:magnesium-transporting ATPase (P-type)
LKCLHSTHRRCNEVRDTKVVEQKLLTLDHVANRKFRESRTVLAAHIGVAMGGRGTDVAREASSIVLLDDDFGSIVTAIRLGRRIYDNVRKAMGFIFAVHVPIAGLALLPLAFGLPIIFSPIHIAFLEMVIDPVCSLVFEAETDEEDVMRRRPRAPDEPLFSWPTSLGVSFKAASHSDWSPSFS